MIFPLEKSADSLDLKPARFSAGLSGLHLHARVVECLSAAGPGAIQVTTFDRPERLESQALFGTGEALAQALNDAGIAPSTTSRARRQTQWYGAAVRRIVARGSGD